ncbi:MAG: transposase, partial [Terracidiphilus sp.]
MELVGANQTRQPALLPHWQLAATVRQQEPSEARVSRGVLGERGGEIPRATRLWQNSAPGKGVVFDFEMTRSKGVPKAFFKDYGGILHTDGYAAYEKDIGLKDLIHACRLAHAQRKFIDAVKVQAKAKVTDPQVERVVALMDGLFAIDREVHYSVSCMRCCLRC